MHARPRARVHGLLLEAIQQARIEEVPGIACMKASGRGCTPGLGGFSTLPRLCSVRLTLHRSITSAMVSPTFNTSSIDRYRNLMVLQGSAILNLEFEHRLRSLYNLWFELLYVLVESASDALDLLFSPRAKF